MRSTWIFTILLFIGVSLAITLNSTNCPLPRVRYRWNSLTASQQQNYLSAVQQMKNYQEKPYASATYTRSLYDIFSLTHSCSIDAAYAHGSDGFFVWHRHFMWMYESALQEVVTKYNNYLLSINANTGYLDACVTVPYWDWENDYQKETQCKIFLSSAFGAYNEDSCVTTGPFTNWAGADQTYCLYRSLNVKTNGGIAVGAAQIINYIVSSNVYDTYRSNVEGVPHGSVHMWVGGDIGNMGNMWSPDDPVFYVHHSNIDRLWALWQDCYDYNKLSTTNLPSRVFPSSWTNAGGQTVKRTSAMPYNVDLDGGTFPSYRFTYVVHPTDMQSIGSSASNPGFNGMYYRYGPDQIVTSINSMSKYKGICNFDGDMVNYSPSKKRSLEQNWFEFNSSTSTPETDPSNSTSFENDTETEQFLFGSKNLETVIKNIEHQYSHHAPNKKLHYLALWECSEENKLDDRNYTVPLRWCKMNGIDPNDWKTVCEKEGWTHGYHQVAELEEQQLASANNQNQKPSWVLPVSITAAAVVLLVIIVIIVLIVRKKRQSEQEQY